MGQNLRLQPQEYQQCSEASLHHLFDRVPTVIAVKPRHLLRERFSLGLRLTHLMKASLSRPSSSSTTPTRRLISNVAAARPCPRRIASRFSGSASLLDASPRLQASHWRICAAAEEEVELEEELEEEEAAVEEGYVSSLFGEDGEMIHMSVDDEEDDDDEGQQKPRRIDGFEQRVVELRRVASTAKGGRKIRFRAVMVVGDGQGTVGIGNATAKEIPNACQKAVARAKKQLITFDLNKQTFSFPHRQEAKLCSSKVVLVPAVDGTGVGGIVAVLLVM